MIKFLLTTFLVFFLFIPSIYGSSTNYWTKADIITESIWVGMHYLDWKQTLKLVDDDDFYEMNPILGRNPTKKSVNEWAATTLLAHLAITHFSKAIGMRDHWLGITVVVKSGVILHNVNIGLLFRW